MNVAEKITKTRGISMKTFTMGIFSLVAFLGGTQVFGQNYVGII